MVAKIESSPCDEDELLHGYWEFSDRSSPNYYSTGPSVLCAPVAVADSSFPLMHCSSPPPPSHSHHQPLPARFHSSYSELSTNVAFMCETKSQLTSSSRDSTHSNSESQSRPPTPAVTHPTLQHTSRSRIPLPAEPSTLNRSDSVPQSRHASRHKNKTEGERRGSSSSPRALGNKVLSGRKGSDVRRQPSLACFFCRGRKIACGQPAEGSTDRTCKYVPGTDPVSAFVLTWWYLFPLVNVLGAHILAIIQWSRCVVSIRGERPIRMATDSCTSSVLLHVSLSLFWSLVATILCLNLHLLSAHPYLALRLHLYVTTRNTFQISFPKSVTIQLVKKN
jgi:hypothetical protein